MVRHANAEERRAKIVNETLKETNKPRYGYFGFAPPLCIGDNTGYAKVERKVINEDAEPVRNICATVPKKGGGPDTLFSFTTPLCVGDPYLDQHRVQGRRKQTQVDPEASFRPPGQIKHPALPFEYVEECTQAKDPKKIYAKYKDRTPVKNFVTNPTKKGGGGVLTPGVLFTDFPEHVPCPYDAAKDQKYAEMKQHHTKTQETPFRSMYVGSEAFQKSSELYHCDVPYGVPKEMPKVTTPAAHDVPFRPPNPSKQGHNATMYPFPEWQKDPVHQAVRQKRVEDPDAPPAWRPPKTKQPSNPSPSVVMNYKNLKAAHPASFRRPKI